MTPVITRVAVVQAYPSLGETQKNIDLYTSLIQREKADIYVLPELAMSGYNFTSSEQVSDLAEEAGAGPSFEAIARFCRDEGSYVAYGFPERGRDAIYNSSSLVGPDGLIGTYRKTHLFDREKIFFLPGDSGFNVLRLPFGSVGMMICFDWYFPEAMRTLALKGAQLVLHPSNLVMPHCPDAMVTRCLENRVYAATADRVGTERDGKREVTFIGLSEIISPRGEILVRLGRFESGVGIAECDLSLATSKQINERNDIFHDRRPALYS